jgi:hypothetical protein
MTSRRTETVWEMVALDSVKDRLVNDSRLPAEHPWLSPGKGERSSEEARQVGGKVVAEHNAEEVLFAS